MAFSELNTQQRALQINLDRRIYGTFAEIGAGQEIARWFFRVGGAAGTVAKTISAYDMTVSDAIYGKSSRYVARDRVIAMINHEYDLLLERLAAARGESTSFFVFANTVSARNYLGTNECHGWMGMRFQMQPGSPPSDVILHVNMLDRENVLQQEALGIVGVNLIYGACYDRENIDYFIENLVDDVGQERIEIDILEFSGPAFAHVDNRVVGLKLLQLGLANAIVYDSGNRLMQPSEIVHKRPVLIERGGFRAMHRLSLGSVKKVEESFAESVRDCSRDPISFLELTMHEAAQKETITPEKTLEKIDALTALGNRVLVSKFYEFYQVTSYLRRYTDEPIGYLMGIATLIRLMTPYFYEHLEGRFLEGLGRVLSHNVRLYAYPMYVEDVRELLSVDGSESVITLPEGKSMITIADLPFPKPIDSLFNFLLESRFIEAVGDEPPAPDGTSTLSAM